MPADRSSSSAPPAAPATAGAGAPTASGAEHLLPWRGRILQNTLTTTAVLASIAYVPGVLVAYSAELWLLMAVDTLLWGAIVLLALRDELPFALRACGLVGAWYVLGAVLLWMVGPMGSGLAWLLAVPVLAALLFGYRGAMTGVALVFTLSVVYYFLLPVHRTGALGAGPSYASEAWIACAASLTFLAALLSLSTARLLRGLEDSLAELEVAHREVSENLSEREQLQAELLLSQKQSALGTLAGGIAHDFNNILVPILMASEEARDDAPANSPQRAHLDRVIAAALRARNLIRRILDFSRSSAVQREPVAVEPVLREVGTLLRSSAPHGVSIRYQIDDTGAEVLADTSELHQILMNLGTNACLAMEPTGGELTFTLTRDDDGDTVRLEVVDTGPGIPAELQERVFDPFFTTRESGTGTGLGLSITHRLVTDMGGTISLHSAAGHGARFVLRFPSVESGQAAHQGPAVATPAITPPPERPARVLVVDDEEMVRGMMAVTLSRGGFEVVEAATPESALRRVHDDPDAIDLVITDQAMPYMTGLQLVRDLRMIRPDLAVVLASGHLSPEEMTEAESLSLAGILDKPFGRGALLDLARRAVQQPSEGHDMMPEAHS